jgi:predicted DCC family thiol-disulfide oxidoreductase YuxK
MPVFERAARTMSEPSLIIYDGECIFCQNYVRFVRLRETIGPVELLDARSDDPRIAPYWRRYDLNEGMLFVHRGGVYYGAEAVHVLAGLSSERGAFNRLNARLFSHGRVASVLYPLLKMGRRLTLVARGRKLMQPPGGALAPPVPAPRENDSLRD